MENKKELLMNFLGERSPEESKLLLNAAGVDFNFEDGFEKRVLERISQLKYGVMKERDLFKSINTVFLRVAISGVAAILLLIFSIFLSGEPVSFQSLLGLGNNVDETVLTLLAGF